MHCKLAATNDAHALVLGLSHGLMAHAVAAWAHAHAHVAMFLALALAHVAMFLALAHVLMGVLMVLGLCIALLLGIKSKPGSIIDVVAVVVRVVVVVVPVLATVNVVLSINGSLISHDVSSSHTPIFPCFAAIFSGGHHRGQVRDSDFKIHDTWRWCPGTLFQACIGAHTFSPALMSCHLTLAALGCGILASDRRAGRIVAAFSAERSAANGPVHTQHTGLAHLIGPGHHETCSLLKRA